MAAVVVIGGILAIFLTRRNPAAGPATAPTPAPAVTAAPVAMSLTPPETLPTPARALDPMAIQQEVQRELAAKRQEMLKGQKGVKGQPTAAPKQAAESVPVAVPTEAAVERLIPTSAPEVPTSPPPEPTEVAVAPSPEPRQPAETVASRENTVQREAPPAAAPEPEVSRGDLVGPGPGVVEPTLLTPPRIAYPPIARRQKLSGRVVILVLVNENGAVADARVQKGIGGRTGIDGVVLSAVRGSRFRAATKNGIPVKMWRTVVVDVKP
jgi:protein TonB